MNFFYIYLSPFLLIFFIFFIVFFVDLKFFFWCARKKRKNEKIVFAMNAMILEAKESNLKLTPRTWKDDEKSMKKNSCPLDLAIISIYI